MTNLTKQSSLSPRSVYEQRYKTSRMNLLLVVAFTAVNLLLLITNADSYFLFSAFVPYFIATVGMLICGRFPEEYYTDGLEEMTFLGDSVFAILLVISAVITLLYLLAWLLSSKNRVGWLIFSLVFFSLDTIGMLFINGISVESVMDILFHAWVIYYLVIGIQAHYKLKKLPVEEESVFSYEAVPQPVAEEGQNPASATEEMADSFTKSDE